MWVIEATLQGTVISEKFFRFLIFGVSLSHLIIEIPLGIGTRTMPPKKNNKSKNGNGGTLGIENELWEAADKLRGHLDAAEYKSVVLGLIFLKYISDMFEQVR